MEMAQERVGVLYPHCPIVLPDTVRDAPVRLSYPPTQTVHEKRTGDVREPHASGNIQVSHTPLTNACGHNAPACHVVWVTRKTSQATDAIVIRQRVMMS